MSERITLHLNDIISDGERGVMWALRGRVAVANGCFDGIHTGHLSIFAALDTLAYQYALRPIVALNSDASAKSLKGPSRPFYPQGIRAALINHLKWPLTVVIFDENTPQRFMDFFQPQIVVKGSEYAADSVVKWKESRVIRVDMIPDVSTTKLRGDTR